jgi:hypothetical protein
MTIRTADDGLFLAFDRTDRLRGPLQYFKHNTFIVRWEDRTLEADAFVKFELDFEGAIRTVTMKAVSPLTDFSFDFHDLEFTKVVPVEGD